MTAIVRFCGADGDLLKLKFEESGPTKRVGRNLAFFLHDNPDLVIEKACVKFCSSLNSDTAFAVAESPSSTTNSNREYVVKFDKAWSIAVRASKTTSNMSLDEFFVYCKTDPSKKPVVVTNSKATKVQRKRSPSGYHIFGNHVRQKMKEENSELNPKSAMTEIGKRWRDLSENEREDWNKKAKTDTKSE